MNNRGVVIVAIPRVDDYVWNISSEKVPHLTMLFLGENPENISEIEEFLKHVADTSMHKFGLSVDRRGELGENKADVLFFDKRTTKQLETIRSYLLTNSAINKAYNSSNQFPEWIPHLTLGFPDAPAKVDTRDYPGTSWVSFDVIALWNDDSEGPEFPLKENDAWEVSMSDKLTDVLAHFGVKGMQWGVRRSASQLDAATEDHTNAVNAKAKAKKSGTKALSNKELQDLVTRMNLEQQYSRIVPPSRGKRIVTGGAKIVGDILLSVGKQQATKIAADHATQVLGSLLKK